MSKTKEQTEVATLDTMGTDLAPMPTFSIEDIDVPLLNIVQKMSAINFELGSLVLEKAHEIVPADTKVKCVVLTATKKWKEEIPYGEQEMPQIFLTQQQVDIAMEERGPDDYDIIEFAEIIFLIEQPEDNEDSDTFPYNLGDTNYCLGRLYVQKDAYRMTFKKLATFLMMNPDARFSEHFWGLETQVMTKGKHSWYVPVLSASRERVPEEVAAFASRWVGK